MIMKSKIVFATVCFLVAVLYVIYKSDTSSDGVPADSNMEQILDGGYDIGVDPDFSYGGE